LEVVAVRCESDRVNQELPSQLNLHTKLEATAASQARHKGSKENGRLELIKKLSFLDALCDTQIAAHGSKV
jgi:hypothetical protein